MLLQQQFNNSLDLLFKEVEIMEKKTLKKINKKALFKTSDNIAEQNAAIAIGGGVTISYWLLVALGIVLVTGVITSGGCSCSCRCGTSRNVMKAAMGWGENAIQLAR